MKKKLVAGLLAIVMVFSLAACGSETSDSADSSVSTETVDAETGVLELGNYSGLTVQVDKTEVTDALVETYSKYFYNSIAHEISWNVEAKLGDTVVIDYVGKKDGVAFEGGTADGYSLTLGSHSFIDGFEDGLVGILPGETRDLDLTFPEEYHNDELAGQAVVFTVTCKNVIPTISDENVAAIQDDNFKSIEELNAYSRKLLETYYQSNYETSIVTSVLDIVVENSNIVVPDEVLSEKCEYVTSIYAEEAAQYGLDVPTYLTYYGTNVGEIATMFAKRDLVFEAIAEKEGFVFTDEEVDAFASNILKESGSTLTLEEEYETNSREFYREELMLEKVYEFILANTTVESTKTETISDVSAAE